MDYRGPQQADYANVQALNGAFLALLQRPQHTSTLLAGLPPALREQSRQLTGLQRERLATAPFLLFSFREQDGAYWDQLFRAQGPADLFAGTPLDEELARLVAAGLGYLWQLARRNAYAARILCCASLHWCEQLAERPLLDIVSAATRDDVLILRAPTDAYLWHKLLHLVTSAERAVSDAARVSALQRLLTSPAPSRAVATARAARRLQPRTLRVAEDNER
jgi:hypothetical protein